MSSLHPNYDELQVHLSFDHTSTLINNVDNGLVMSGHDDYSHSIIDGPVLDQGEFLYFDI